jgi:hypothetical protein
MTQAEKILEALTKRIHRLELCLAEDPCDSDTEFAVGHLVSFREEINTILGIGPKKKRAKKKRAKKKRGKRK